VVATVLKGGEDGGYVLRAHESTGRAHRATITVLDSTIEADFGANEIKTFVLRDGAAVEADLLEL
jgi:hypothetical protein